MQTPGANSKNVFGSVSKNLLLTGVLFCCATVSMSADWTMHRGGPRLDGYSSMDASAAPGRNGLLVRANRSRAVR